MKQFRLWTLNDTVAHFENGTHWDYAAPQPTNQVRFKAMKRTPLENVPNATLGVPTRNTHLMHEGTRVDEYWVPLAVKCIGDPNEARPQWVNTADPVKSGLFDNIVAHHHAQFANLASYWQPLPWDGTRKMGTRSSMGLYDLLQKTTPPGEMNILIGYSEGGLVARFLSLLDEHVSKRPVIAGFITVHSPNAGSVFGAKKNADRILAGMLSLIFCASRIDKKLCGVFHDELMKGVPAGAGDAMFAWLGAAAKLGLTDVQQRYDAEIKLISQQMNQNDPSFETKLWSHPLLRQMRAKSDVLYTMYRWLSGVRGDDNYPFVDFDVRRIDEDFSVLGSLYDHPFERIHHAALVGYDAQVGDLIFPGLLPEADNFIPFLKDIQADVAEQSAVLIAESGALGPVADVFRAFLDNGVAGVTADHLKIYSGKSLRTGQPDWKPAHIPARAHDYIVPAAYQIIAPHDDPKSTLIGNFVFDDETHANGVGLCGPSLKNLLGVFAKRLA